MPLPAEAGCRHCPPRRAGSARRSRSSAPRCRLNCSDAGDAGQEGVGAGDVAGVIVGPALAQDFAAIAATGQPVGGQAGGALIAIVAVCVLAICVLLPFSSVMPESCAYSLYDQAGQVGAAAAELPPLRPMEGCRWWNRRSGQSQACR